MSSQLEFIIQNKIYRINGKNVMLDFDLAFMYSVETRSLKQAVKRNLDRFPLDFMFKLTKTEWQEVITICDNLPETIKFSPIEPLAFTEQGVAMLSSILKSKRAIQVNIDIIRAFVLMRQYALNHVELNAKLKALEEKYDVLFHDINDAINYLLLKDSEVTKIKKRKRIGFK